MYFPRSFSSSSSDMSFATTLAPPSPPPGAAREPLTVSSPATARTCLASIAAVIPSAPRAITADSERIASAATKDSPLAFGSSAQLHTSYPSLCNDPRIFSSDFGTFNKAAVPTAPTFGGKPYREIAILRSDFGVRRNSTQLFTREVNLRTRSGTNAILSPTSPPRTTVSMAPSSSGKEYSTTDCNPRTPFSCQSGMLCNRRGPETR
mmetsp:Transcript_13619/g.27396  ORF Transcript_13619/g.27396 Transcript_13619/m.27396 type:complete len:207 (-) Transcript_13619:1417-2037(-)